MPDSENSKRILSRAGIIFLALVCVALSLYSLYSFAPRFRHASYMFVTFFLLLTLLSNILAKLAVSYVETI